MPTDRSSDRHPLLILGIGASVSELEALEQLVLQLPPEMDAACVIIVHLSSDFRSSLLEGLRFHPALPIDLIEDGMTLQPRRVYLLPPGQRLHLTGNTLRLTSSPLQAGSTIDPFFQSLAQEWGDRAIGVLLADTDSDGRAGLEAIHRAGGLALVPSPSSARLQVASTFTPRRSTAPDQSGEMPLPPNPAGMLQLCLGNRAITCLLVNEDYQLLHVYHNAAQVLETPTESAGQDVTRIVWPHLSFPLVLALHQVRCDRQSVTFSGMRASQDGEGALFTLRVGIGSTNACGDSHFVVVFERQPLEGAIARGDLAAVRHTELELHRSRQLREAIFSESTDAIFLVDAATRLTFDCNPRAVELFEADSKAALLNLDVKLLRRELLPPSELVDLPAEIGVEGFWEGEVEFVTRQGNGFWGQLATKHIQVAGQHIHLVRVTDITARKQAEQILTDYNRALEEQISIRTAALRESEARFRAIAENLPGAVFQYVLHADGAEQVVYVSQGCYDLWEIEAEVLQANSQALWDAIDPDDLQGMYESLLESAHTLQPWFWTWRITTPSGKRKWLQGAGRPTRRRNGDVVWEMVVLDMSDRRRTEAALQEATARLERAQQIAHLGSWERDLVTDKLVWSRETLEIFGLPSDTEVTYNSFMNCVHPDDVECLRHAQEAMLSRGIPIDLEYRIVRTDGSIRFIQEQGEAVFDAEGQPLRIFGTVLDITDRKQTELALQESEQFLRSIYDYSHNAIFVVDVTADGDFRYAGLNRSHETSTGLSSDMIQGKSPEEVVAPELAATIRQNYQRCIDMETVITYEEYLPFQGQDFWWLTSLSPIRDSGGRIYRLIGTSHNITDRKQAEKALQISEARFRTIFEHSAIGIAIVFPPDYRLTLTNVAFRELLGYSPDELAGMDYTQFTLPEDLLSENQLIAECLAGDRHTYQIEKRYICKDGRIIWANLVTSIVRDEAGEIQFAVAMVEDITERKRAVDLEISRNRDLKEAIFEESTDALFLVDGTTGLTVDCNQRAVDLFEAERKDQLLNIAGTTFQKQPFAEEEHPAALADFHQKGVWTDELEYSTFKGNTFWGRISAKKLCIADVEMRLVQVADVSDRKQIELDIRRNMEELQRLNQTKDDFLSTVSHELRTPLTSIDMAGRMLRIALEQQSLITEGDAPSSNKFLRYLKILEDQTQQEGDLINDLLDLQRLNANAFTLDLVEIDLLAWLTSIVDSIRERAEQEQQIFQVAIAPHLPSLKTDPAVLRRILSELLNNACKYTPPQERICLTVASVTTAHAPMAVLQICVLNTGVEISAADQERVFEPFYRAVKGDRWSKRGTGLGLSLVRKFVDCLQGTIQVSSGANQTCFTVELPFQEGLRSG